MPTRFIVIGGGIAGASAAYELAAYGDVLVLERESSPAYHSTGRSVAIYSSTYGNAPIRALSTASRGFFDAPPAGFADHTLLTPSGELIVGRSGSEGRLDDLARAFQVLTPSVRRLTAGETIALVPVLRRDWLAGGVYEPDAMHMDVDAIHQGYLRGLKARGGRIVLNTEVSGLHRAHTVWRVETGTDSYEADIVVNAAGAWADVIGAMAGAKPIGLMPKRRSAAIMRFPEGVDGARWPFVIDLDETFYFKPESGKLLVSPADETDSEPVDAYPDDYDIAVALDHIQQAADLPVTRVERSWAGLRSFVADRSPVVGYDPIVPGFFWCAGQGGYGIQSAPAMGRVSAALATGDSMPDDLATLGLMAETLSPGRCQG